MDRLRTALVDHRRLLAAACAGLAVLLAVTAARQPDDTVPVLVAADDLASGVVLARADVGTAHVPEAAVPDGALRDVDEVAGLRVGGPMRAGEAFTDARLLTPGALDGRPPDSVVSTVSVADPATLQGLRVGDRVDVVAVTPAADDGPRAQVVAEGLEVAALPRADDDGAAALSLVAARDTAIELARASLEARLSVLGIATTTP